MTRNAGGFAVVGESGKNNGRFLAKRLSNRWMKPEEIAPRISPSLVNRVLNLVRDELDLLFDPEKGWRRAPKSMSRFEKKARCSGAVVCTVVEDNSGKHPDTDLVSYTVEAWSEDHSKCVIRP